MDPEILRKFITKQIWAKKGKYSCRRQESNPYPSASYVTVQYLPHERNLVCMNIWTGTHSAVGWMDTELFRPVLTIQPLSSASAFKPDGVYNRYNPPTQSISAQTEQQSHPLTSSGSQKSWPLLSLTSVTHNTYLPTSHPFTDLQGNTRLQRGGRGCSLTIPTNPTSDLHYHFNAQTGEGVGGGQIRVGSDIG